MSKSTEAVIRLRAHELGLDDWNTSSAADLRRVLAQHDVNERLAAKIVALVQKAGGDSSVISRAQSMFRE